MFNVNKKVIGDEAESSISGRSRGQEAIVCRGEEVGMLKQPPVLHFRHQFLFAITNQRP